MAKKKSVKKRTNNTNKKNSSSMTWFIIVVVIVIGVVISMNLKTSTQTFNCEDGKKVEVKFDKNNAKTTLKDKSINLSSTPSAGGARYANADESIVLWNTGDTVTVDENGETTYKNCTKK